MKRRNKQPTSEPLFTLTFTDEELAQRNYGSTRYSHQTPNQEPSLPDFMSDESLLTSTYLKGHQERMDAKAEKKRQKRNKIAKKFGAATLAVSLLAVGALKLTGGEGEDSVAPTASTEHPAAEANPAETTTTISDYEEQITTTNEAEPILQEKLIDAKPISVSITPKEAEYFPNVFESKTVNLEEFWIKECNSQNVELPTTPQYEIAKIGAQTEFAIPTSDLESLFAQMDSLQDKAQVEKVISDYAKIRLGIDLKFDESVLTVSSGFGPGDPNLTLDKYVGALKLHLRGLANMPKELIMNSSVVQISLFEDNIGSWGSDSAVGEYISSIGEDEGFIRLESFNPEQVMDVIIHEFGHAIHDKACGGVSGDGVLKYVWTSAINSLESNPRYVELSEKRERYNTDPTAITYEEWKEYEQLLKVQGLPSEYSKSAEYELFAEIFADLVINGYTNTPEEGINNPTRQMLYEAVIERLQVVAPNTDIGAWLQFTSMYSSNGLRPDIVDPKSAVEDAHSPLDRGAVEDPRLPYEGIKPINALAGYPVVALEYGDRTEIIYGYFDPIDEIMYLRINGDTSTPELAQVQQAIERYAAIQELKQTTVVYADSTYIELRAL